jgi:hypothetical protein
MGTMSLRVDFSDWIILECSIGANRCLPGVHWNKPMLLLGWHSIVCRCYKSPLNCPGTAGLTKVFFTGNIVDIDIASKFLEHFLFIADALSFDSKTGDRIALWHKDDGFYYDAINWGGPWKEALPIKSLVGLIPLFAVLVLEPEALEKFPGFKRRFEWFLQERKGLSSRIIGSTGTSTTSTHLSSFSNSQSISENGSISPDGIEVSDGVVSGASNALSCHPGIGPRQSSERQIATENLRREHPRHRRLFALVDEDRLRKILTHMLNETQFLSDYGVRSYSDYSKNLTIACPRNILLHPKGNHLTTS